VLAQEAQGSTQQSLAPVTVTATTNPVAAFEYPGQVSVISRPELRNLNPSSVNDILRFVPGVESVGGPRRTGEVPSIRGFDGPDVTVLFDGVRQDFNSGHDGRLFIEPDLLGAVEIVRGPTSALYGSGGLGGTIEFRTFDAADLLPDGKTMGASGKVGYGTADGDNNYNATAFAKAGGLDVIGSASFRDAGEIELGDGTSLRDNARIRSGLLKGTYNGVPDHSFELSYLGFRGDVTEPGNPQGLGSGGLADKDLVNDTVRAGWRWADPDKPWLDLNLLTYYVRNSVVENTLENSAESPAGTRLERQVDTTGLRADNRSRIAHGSFGHSLLTYGVEAFRDDQDGSSTATEDGERSGVPDADALTTAAFVQNELTLVEPFGTPGSWYIVPGLRYDHFSNSSKSGEDSDDGAVSPKLGVSYLPTDWLLFFGSVAHAFRAPTFDELYADGLHFSIPGFGDNFFISNPDLKPQKTWNYELGTGLTFDSLLQAGDRFEVKGSYFWIHGDDFIDLRVDQPGPPACFPPTCNGTTQAVNVADAELEGWDISGLYENSRVIFRAGFSTLDGEDENTGRPLGVLQPNKLTTQLGFKLPEINSLVGARAIFAGRLDRAEPGEERDAYQVYDLFASWQPAGGRLEGFRLDLAVENLFDKTYYEVFTDAAEEGRDYRVAVSYTLTW
jgi:hemoglobin/transferrin/lactoferrin receptor protein